MTDVDFEYNLYRKAILKVSDMLKIIGLSLNKDYRHMKLKDFRQLWGFCLNLLCLFLNIVSQILWLVQTSHNGILSLVELTYVSPCLTLCALGCVKSFFFVKKTKMVDKLVRTLNTLYSSISNLGTEEKKKVESFMHCHLKLLNKVIKTLTALNVFGVIAFSVGPIIILISQYYLTGILELLLPFRILYPFNPLNICVWPFAYIHQIWSAIIAVFSVLGPDSLFHTSCVLLNVKFFELKQEIEAIFDRENDIASIYDGVIFKLAGIIDRHKQLLRSVELIESIYSESTLFNILTSSFLICFTGFNVVAYDNILIMTPFIIFLFMVVGQIFVLCYYGDLIQRSSGELSNAVYNSAWYKEKATIVQNLMIISARAQKPCKLRAFGFADINIQAFTKIMSTAWSYFAVLLSIHKNN